MSTSRITMTDILSSQDVAAIDSLVPSATPEEALATMGQLLQDRFGLPLTTDPDIVEGFAQDSSNLPGAAVAVCRPTTESQCAAVMRLCHRLALPLTISAGKSNLTGSATPAGGVILSTVNLVTPDVQVDATGKTATAPVGLLLEDLRKTIWDATGHALTFPLDPTSRGEASLGGALACNASGFTPGEQGACRAWVQGVRFILPDGRGIMAARGDFLSADGAFQLVGNGGKEDAWPIPTYARPPIKNASGPFSAPDGILDFVDLTIGSEGLFGLVTSATLQLTEQPKGYLDLFFSLPTEADALRLQKQALADNDGDLSKLTAFEYFGVNCRNYMKHQERFFHAEDQVAVYMQQPLFDEDEDAAIEAWLECVEESGAQVAEEGMLALDTTALRELFLEARHSMPANALEVVQERKTFTIMTDAVVPPEHFPEFLSFTHGLLQERDLEYLSFGHLGDCHLHFTVLPHEDQVEQGVATYDAIIAEATRLGGVYSGEHGTGKRKRLDFERCYGTEAVEQLRTSKAAVDPQFLLNRGNVLEGPEA